MEIKLSVVIITFNEEENIRRCLESVEGIADEIIVVDSYSIDRTKAICEEFNTKFIEHEFEGHVEQKNFAFSQCRGEYILSLDADEALSPELRECISELKKSFKFKGYKLNRLTWYQGAWIRHSGWYPDTKLRLVQNGMATWKGENPHDRLELNDNIATSILQGDLYHYSFKDLTDHAIRTDTYSSIAAREAYRKGIKPGMVKLILNPAFTFIKKFFLQLGFLDGYNGFLIARMAAYGKFLKYSKLKELHAQ
jgi:glycosyltransferase involved in cell wall biosynthesis